MESNKEHKLYFTKKAAKYLLESEIHETEFSPAVVQHPFFESAMLCDNEGFFNAFEDADRLSTYIKNFYEQRILPCESVLDVLTVVRKSYKLTFISVLKQSQIVSKKECGDLLASVWTEVEMINHDTNVRKVSLLSWIKEADKNILMDEEDRAVYDNLPKEITIYRGCNKKGDIKGFGWTIDKKMAIWFSKRFGEGYVYCGKIDKSDVIAYTNQRKEKEIIPDYNKIYGAELI